MTLPISMRKAALLFASVMLASPIRAGRVHNSQETVFNHVLSGKGAPAPAPKSFSPIVSPTVSPATASPATASPATASPATASPATASPATASPATASPATASPSTLTPTSTPTLSSLGLVYARVGDAFNRVECWFTRETTSPDSGCSSLLSASTLALFGSAPVCVWANPKQLDIYFGKGFTISLGATVEVNPTAIQTSDGENVVSPTVLLTAPANPMPLSLIISGTETVGSCGSLQISATVLGSSGRTISFKWACVSKIPATSASGANSQECSANEQEIIRSISTNSSLSNQELSVVSSTFQDGYKYNLSLRATNWLMHSRTTFFAFQKKSSQVPTIDSTSPSVFSIRRSEPLTIHAKVSLKGCNSTTTLAKSGFWTQVFGNSSFLSSSAVQYASILTNDRIGSRTQGFTLSIPGNTLKMGHTYGFNLHGSLFDAAEGVLVGDVNATYVVSIVEDPVTASIKGGSSRVISVIEGQQNMYIFDASASEDPMASSLSSSGGLLYSWSLEHPNGTVVQLSQPSSSARNISIDFSSLNATSMYKVMVEATGEPSVLTSAVRKATATQLVITRSVPVPLVEVTRLSSDGETKTAPTNKVVLRVSVSNFQLSDVTIQWSVSPSLALSGNNILSSTSTGQTLVVAPNVLTPGATYSFKASVSSVSTDASSSSMGFGTLGIVINSPPSLGTCSASPEKGIALSEEFRLSCDSWEDEDTPLQYRFQIQDNVASTIQVTQLSDFQRLSYLNTILPSPANSSDGNLTIVAGVNDALGAQSSFQFSLQILPQQNFNASSSLSTLTKTLQEGDENTAAVLILGIASSLQRNTDSTGASIAEARTRRTRLISSVSSFVSKNPSLAAKLLSASTDVSKPEELSAETKDLVVTNIGQIISSFSGVTTQSLDDSTTTALATGLGNLVSSTSGVSADNNTAAAANFSSSLETQMLALGEAMVSDAFAGEKQIEVNTPVVQIVAKAENQDGTNGTKLESSSGAAMTISSVGTSTASSSSTAPTTIVMASAEDPLYPGASKANSSGILTIEVKQDGQKLHNVSVSMKIPKTLTQEEVNTQSFRCRYWNESQKQWQDNGLTFLSASTSGIQCFSTHLTAFSSDAGVSVNVNTIGKDDVTKDTFDPRKNPIMRSIAVALVVYFLLIFIALWFDSHNKHTRNRAEDYAKFWRYYNRVRRLRLSPKRGYPQYRDMVCWGFKRVNPWSLFCQPQGDYMTSTKRVIGLGALLGTSITCCALLLNQEQKLPYLNKAVSTALVSIVFSMPVPFIMAKLFYRHVPGQFFFHLLSYGFCGPCGTFMMVLLLLLGCIEGQDMDDQDVGDGFEGEDNDDVIEQEAVDADDNEDDEVQNQGNVLPLGVAAGGVLASGDKGSNSNYNDKKERKIQYREFMDLPSSEIADEDGDSTDDDDDMEPGFNGAKLKKVYEGLRSSAKARRKQFSTFMPGSVLQFDDISPFPKEEDVKMEKKEVVVKRSSVVRRPYEIPRSWRCCCCEVSSDPKAENDVWHTRDLAAFFFGFLVLMGCCFILATLSWRLKDEFADFQMTILLIILGDFGMRLVRIVAWNTLLYSSCMFLLPFCYICGCVKEPKDETDEIVKIEYSPGTIDFTYSDLKILAGDRLTKGYEGWKIIMIEDEKPENDRDIHKLLVVAECSGEKYHVVLRQPSSPQISEMSLINSSKPADVASRKQI